MMTAHPKTVRGARDTLLRHPLSNISDIRLVSAVELLLMENQILETLPSKDSDDPRCQRHLHEGRVRMDAWEAEWNAILGESYEQSHAGLSRMHPINSPEISFRALHADDLIGSAKLQFYGCEIASICLYAYDGLILMVHRFIWLAHSASFLPRTWRAVRTGRKETVLGL